ncbi:FHA domain-containing protein [Nostoc sphaeroides CHAB 2801]|uniref:FHA domain-containing protein n=1 Tax=Nostoc sphaeroides TaxID=446679 RepID=UPI001E398A38|nr:FHA domain-containing protein [Nostoc sphaeroides]MCC5632282.1 FHA domain-containing protein [Nostoc sphaeroides CHAB 2801]
MKIKISNSLTESEFEEIDLSLTTRRGVEYIVGRSPDSDLVLDSEDVSRRHGKFFSQSGNYYFSDLGSRNGTILNGKSAEKNHSYILRNGDIIRIGDFALIMEEDMSSYEQSETVVRIINPSMFSNRQVSRNINVPDVATPSSELVNQSQEVAEPVISESIAFDTPLANEIDNTEKVVNTFEESATFVQSSDEEFAVNSAEIITPDNAVEPQEDVDLDIPVEQEIAANISGVEYEYTIVQARDVFQNDEDNLDLDAEEIAAQTQETISQEDNLDLDAEEIAAQTHEAISQEDNLDLDAEEIAAQTHEAISQEDNLDLDAEEIAAQTHEAISQEDNLDLDTEEIAVQTQEAISQEDNLDLDAEEIAAQTHEAITQEDNLDLDAEEIAAQTHEAITQEDNLDLDAEEIAAQTHEAITQEDNLDLDAEEIAAQTHEAITQEDNLDLDAEEIAEPLQESNIEITEELVSEAVSISTSELISEDSNVSVSQEIQEESAEDISEEASAIKLAKILEDKQIVLISHETKKSELLELVTEHEEFLSYCLTRTWQSFSDYLYRESGLSVTQEIPPATSGGYQAINSLINSGEIIAVIFLRDFIVPQPGQASEEALLRTCNINEILLATNLPTAQAVIHYLKNMKD